ncbi:hypothetical protein HMPREF9710_02610, partial [Massilia timonae CCUG 45783]
MMVYLLRALLGAAAFWLWLAAGAALAAPAGVAPALLQP